MTTEKIIDDLQALYRDVPWCYFLKNAIERLKLLETENASLSAELAKAREVIAKLPKTADGVPILVGSVVWKLAEPISAGVVIQIVNGGVEVRWSNSISFYRYRYLYSTEAEALAAKGPTNG